MYYEHAEVRMGPDKRSDQPKEARARFQDRARVFEDPNMVLMEDRVDEEGEPRWHALGMVAGRFLLIVVHVYREAKNGEEIIRIISAREADQREGRVYFQ
jgi:uncharacterized DUF497 family protein